jgi:hypothetical protein
MEVLSLRWELEVIEASQAATAAGRLEVLWHLEPGPALAGFCNLGFRETAPLAPTQTVPLRDLAFLHG